MRAIVTLVDGPTVEVANAEVHHGVLYLWRDYVEPPAGTISFQPPDLIIGLGSWRHVIPVRP